MKPKLLFLFLIFCKIIDCSKNNGIIVKPITTTLEDGFKCIVNFEVDYGKLAVKLHIDEKRKIRPGAAYSCPDRDDDDIEDEKGNCSITVNGCPSNSEVWIKYHEEDESKKKMCTWDNHCNVRFCFPSCDDDDGNNSNHFTFNLAFLLLLFLIFVNF